MTKATVRLNANASRLARKGRLWFFADDLVGVQGVETGLTWVVDEAGRDLGVGLYCSDARLALRLAGPWPEAEVPDPERFFAMRLREAIERRRGLLGPRAGVRLVHGESDGLPGLVVDSYSGGLVVQVTSKALDTLRPAWVPALVALLEPTFVLARNDLPTRRFEGLSTQGEELLHGRRTEVVEIDEGGVVHRVRPWTGHKTGFYLDQRPARALVHELAATGRGARVLDLFCYQGGFSMAALRGGAESVLAVDESEPALAEAAAAADRNGFDQNRFRAWKGNVFDVLRELRGGDETFDLVVCDPPAFAKSRREVRGALRGYRDLNRLSLRLLERGGHLVTCTCSHHVSWSDFEDVLRQAAGDLPFPVFLRRRLGAGDDHPVRLGMAESEYLKVFLLEVPPA